MVKLAWNLEVPIPGDALLETIGRRTGRPQRTPICDGLDGGTFWVVAQRGRRADLVRNIEANPPRPGQGQRVAYPLADRNGADSRRRSALTQREAVAIARDQPGTGPQTS